MMPNSVSHIVLAILPIPSWSTFTGILTLGVTLLTIALLVLTRRRWGQVTPVTKCIALSVFAHLLLVIYAYDTALLVIPQASLETNLSFGLMLPGDVIPADSFEPVTESSTDSSPSQDSGTEPSIESEPSDVARVAPTDQDPPATDGSVTPEQGVPAPTARFAERQGPVPAPELIPDQPGQDDSRPAENSKSIEGSSAEPQVANANEIATPQLPVDSSPETGDVSSLSTSSPESITRLQTQPNSPARELPNPLADVYVNRQPESRLQIAIRYGGNERTEVAVNRALAWLAAVQSPDGRWDADQFGAGQEKRILGHDRQGAGGRADTGITALALLSFLAAGETHLEGNFRLVVQDGLEFLIRSQAADGNLAGDAEHVARMYCHGMSLLALSEALAMTADERLAGPVERAARFSISTQHFPSGGWRYSPGESGDMSQFGWQVMALKSASVSGISIPARTWTGMRWFLKSVSSGQHGGLASYRPGERPSSTMTAEALTCRIFLGEYNSSGTIDEGASFILQDLPNPNRANFYNWYYGTLGLFQSQDPRWNRWNEALQIALLSTQRSDSQLAGSWDPDPIWGNYGGRIYSTALGALCLEVYYRYLPLTNGFADVQTARGRVNASRSSSR